MKSLFALSLLLVSAAQARADFVTVQVNGKSYSCTEGGAGGGCSCKLSRNTWGNTVYTIQYNGGDIYSGGEFNNPTDALGACKRKIRELDACK